MRVYIFVRAQVRQRFPAPTISLLGALYEAGAGGVVGGLIVPAPSGARPNLLASLAFLPLLAFWQFIPVYRSMVLPPAWVVENLPVGPSRRPAWRQALEPPLWLIPYTAFALLLLLAPSVILPD